MALQHVHNLQEMQAIVNSAGGKLIVVDFFATWCGPCKRIAPVYEQMSSQYTDVVFVKVDVDEAPDVSENYGIQSMPTFVFVKGGSEAGRFSGASEDKLKQTIAQLKCSPCIRIAPVFEQLSTEHPDVKFIKVDVDQAQDVSEQFGVHSMPTFIFLKHGKPLETFSGANDDRLKQTIKKLKLNS